jgi:hypothetical protein
VPHPASPTSDRRPSLRRILQVGVWAGLGLGISGIVSIGGCVDAPITPDQLEPDGQLRAPSLGHSAFSATPRPQAQQAARISAVLAAQPAGPLGDATTFPAEVGQVHLHLRADGLDDARQVVFRWTHAGTSVLVPGRLEPGGTLALASSFAIEPAQVGPWQVEVLGEPGADGEPALLFERTFEVFSPSE